MVGDEIVDEGVTYIVVFDGRQPLVPDRETLDTIGATKAEKKNVLNNYRRKKRTSRRGPARNR